MHVRVKPRIHSPGHFLKGPRGVEEPCFGMHACFGMNPHVEACALKAPQRYTTGVGLCMHVCVCTSLHMCVCLCVCVSQCLLCEKMGALVVSCVMNSRAGQLVNWIEVSPTFGSQPPSQPQMVVVLRVVGA